VHPLIKPELQEKARSYTRKKDILNLLGLAISGIYLIVFYAAGISRSAASNAARFPLPAAVFIYLLSFIPLACILFPISYRRDYVLERRFGLSSQSVKSWLLDQVKASMLGILFGYPLLLLLFYLFAQAPHTWWLFGVCGLVLFQLFITIIFPVLLLPIFFKQRPIEDEDLRKSIRGLFFRAHIKISDVHSFNLSSRTKKENALITGLWKTRRVLLGDTLLQNRSREQVLVVLAHEIGHQLKQHVLKRALLGTAASFILLFIVHRIMIHFPGFPENLHSALTLFPLFVLITGALSFPIRIGEIAYSRAKEREADRIALELTEDPASFVILMADLANTNLAVAYPKKYRVILTYSHPPIGERIQFAQKTEKNSSFYRSSS
jgi:STE24 endopeptidase